MLEHLKPDGMKDVFYRQHNSLVNNTHTVFSTEQRPPLGISIKITLINSPSHRPPLHFIYSSLQPPDDKKRPPWTEERDTHRKELTSKIEASCWIIVISDALKTSIYVIFKGIVWFSVTRTVHTNQTGGSWGESKQFLRSEFSILNAQVLDPQNTDISHLISNLCKRTAEERRREKFCDKRDNNFTLL